MFLTREEANVTKLPPIVQAAEKKTPLRVQLELLSSLMQRRQLKRLAGAA